MSLFDPNDPEEPVLPVLPYAGTSGWAGSETSRERAERADQSGVTTKSQRGVLDFLAHSPEGITVKEARRLFFDNHHGRASNVLSVLHERGLIARLSESREGCKVYVLPCYVAGRITEAPMPTKGTRLLREFLPELDVMLEAGTDRAVIRKRLAEIARAAGVDL